MTEVTSSMVKDLRERTGLGVMDCKRALVEAQGDSILAIENLRKNSGLKAASKASRIAGEGLLAIKVNQDNRCAAMVEVNVETDFAARNQLFIEFVDLVADTAFEKQTENVQFLLDGGLEEARQRLVQEIGEHVDVRRVAVMTAPDGVVAAYLHNNQRIGVLVRMSGSNNELGKDVAMHIAAANPMAVKTSDVPEGLVAKEREIYTAQAQNSGKPAHIVDKMINGRIRKFLNDISLTEQAFIKDPDKKVGQLLKEADAQVFSFYRFEVGEGIAQQEKDFASEVAAQASI